MTAPAISVLLPFRDAADTLGTALKSLQDQTLREIEILAVDDQSQDGGPDLVEARATQDPRITLLRSRPPHGVVSAINTAWPISKAGLVARMDADDLAHPDRLKKQLALLEADPSLSAASCQVEVPGAAGGFQRYIDWSNGLLTPGQIHRERFVECPVVNPTMLVRRQAAEAVGGHLDPTWPEDYDLWLRFLQAGHRIAKVPEVLYTWHDDRPGRLTRSSPRYSEDNFLRCRAHYLARLPGAARSFALCGAGPTGKRLARFLLDEGAAVGRFYEVNPRRLGETIHGIEVMPGHPLPLASPEAPLLLSCVGSPGGRGRVRGLAQTAGYTEGDDFFCCA